MSIQDMHTKQSDGEAPVIMELWGIRRNALLPSFPGPLCARVEATDRVLSIDYLLEIGLFWDLNSVLMSKRFLRKTFIDYDSVSLQYHEVAVHNHCMPQFDFFQTWTTAYKLFTKD